MPVAQKITVKRTLRINYTWREAHGTVIEDAPGDIVRHGEANKDKTESNLSRADVTAKLKSTITSMQDYRG